MESLSNTIASLPNLDISSLHALDQIADLRENYDTLGNGTQIENLAATDYNASGNASTSQVDDTTAGLENNNQQTNQKTGISQLNIGGNLTGLNQVEQANQLGNNFLAAGKLNELQTLGQNAIRDLNKTIEKENQKNKDLLTKAELGNINKSFFGAGRLSLAPKNKKAARGNGNLKGNSTAPDRVQNEVGNKAAQRKRFNPKSLGILSSDIVIAPKESASESSSESLSVYKDESLFDRNDLDVILVKAKSKEYHLQEGDELFKKVSKAYFRVAYTILLTPKEKTNQKKKTKV